MLRGRIEVAGIRLALSIVDWGRVLTKTIVMSVKTIRILPCFTVSRASAIEISFCSKDRVVSICIHALVLPNNAAEARSRFPNRRLESICHFLHLVDVVDDMHGRLVGRKRHATPLVPLND